MHRGHTFTMCEMMITSDNEFFDKIGIEETKRYFEESYKFVCNYKNLGEKYIVSAAVHLDETTPHMHLVYIPVIHTKDELEKEFKNKEFDIEYKYKSKIKSLEKENSHLHKIIDKFYETVEKFIDWVCHKFGIGESKQLIKDFEKQTNTFIDPVKQLEHEELEKEWDLEI